MGLFADMGLDPEADGKLTPSEVAKLQGFNLDWPKDFPGDLYIEAGVKAGGIDHPMSPPFDGVVTVEGGRVHSVLRRKLLTPVDATQGLTIRAYDPYYYNEYTITALPRLEGAPPGCTARLIDPDLTAADTELKAELAKIPTGIDIESEYPAVVRLFAQALQIDCPK